MRILEFIQKSIAAEKPEDVFDLFRAALGDFGFERVAFVSVTPSAREALAKGNLQPVVALNYPEDWVKHYFERRYHEIDPTLLLAPKTAVPFFWKDVGALARLSNRQRMLFLEAEEAGLRNGLAIPVHGANGESFVIELASSEAHEYDREQVSQVQVLSTQFHIAYTSLARGRGEATDHLQLSDRERECLTWTARGKSAWDVSRILGVSEHTVNFHLKSVMKKLGTVNRMTSVVVAVRSGLILP